MSETERTPALADFLTAWHADDNEWWRLQSGDHLNLFEELLDERDEARAELSRLRAVVEAVQALHALDDHGWCKECATSPCRTAALLAPVSSSGEGIEALIERSSLGTPEAKALRASVSDERAAAIVARAEEIRSSSGEAESGEAGKPYDPVRWCRHPECKDTNWGGWGRVHLRDSNCPPDLEGKYLDRQPQDPPPAPVSSGEAESGEAVEIRSGCPTCSGPFRETVGMVCQACGTDYSPADPGIPLGTVRRASQAFLMAQSDYLGQDLAFMDAPMRAALAAARPVLSREVLRERLGKHSVILSWAGPDAADAYLDHLADVLAGGEQA